MGTSEARERPGAEDGVEAQHWSWSMERGLARRGRARSGEGAEVQGMAPVDVDETRRSCCRLSRRSTERRRRDLAGGPRQQGVAAMAGPDGSGRGRRWTTEGDAKQRRSGAGVWRRTSKGIEGEKWIGRGVSAALSLRDGAREGDGDRAGGSPLALGLARERGWAGLRSPGGPA